MHIVLFPTKMDIIRIQRISEINNPYQIYYDLDKDTDNPHIHFAVNTYSYHPDAELLSDQKMEHLSHYILSELQRIFPNTIVRLAYSKEDW